MTTKEKWKILLVDDERHSREAMSDWLESEGFDVLAVADGQQAVKHIHDGIAVIVTDLRMPRTDGMEVLRLAKDQAPHAAVILVSGYGTVETAVSALKEGAFDFLSKPVNAEEIKVDILKRSCSFGFSVFSGGKLWPSEVVVRISPGSRTNQLAT
jgi:DNA-binding NtrC family response regulator